MIWIDLCAAILKVGANLSRSFNYFKLFSWIYPVSLFFHIYIYIYIIYYNLLAQAQKRMTVSVQFSSSVMSDSLRLHGLQHARHPCPSPAPEACSNSYPSNWWYHPTVSSSVWPFSSCLQSFPVRRSFPMSQFFASCSQSIGVWASASEFQLQHQSFQWIFRTDFL